MCDDNICDDNMWWGWLDWGVVKLDERKRGCVLDRTWEGRALFYNNHFERYRRILIIDTSLKNHVNW